MESNVKIIEPSKYLTIINQIKEFVTPNFNIDNCKGYFITGTTAVTQIYEVLSEVPLTSNRIQAAEKQFKDEGYFLKEDIPINAVQQTTNELLYYTSRTTEYDTLNELYVFLKDNYPFQDFLKKYNIIKTYGSLPPGVYTVGDKGHIIEADAGKGDDIYYLNENTEELITQDIEEFMKSGDVYKEMKITHKRGYLLYGPPGNGKTTFIKKLIAKYSKQHYFLYTETDKLYTSNIQMLNEISKQEALKFIIIEDVDKAAYGSLSALFNILDGIVPVEKFVFIFTTNYPEKLDRGFIQRPSRFDVLYKFDNPNFETRKKILHDYFPTISPETLNEACKQCDQFGAAFMKEIFILTVIMKKDIISVIKHIKEQRKELNSFSSGKSEVGMYD